jgi:hypothetical protein
MNWQDVKDISPVVTACVAVFTACVAVYATNSWLRGIRNERIDKALEAVHDLRDRINRVVAIRASPNRDSVWRAYSEAWDSRSRFNQAYEVARRYYPKRLLQATPREFTACLDDLKVHIDNGCDATVADRFRDRVSGIVDRTAKALQETSWWYRVKNG